MTGLRRSLRTLWIAPLRPGRRGLIVMDAALAPVIALTGVSAAQATNAPSARGTGWTTVFDDNFAGPAGSAPNSCDRMNDTGPGGSFSVGEIETMMNSAGNVYLGGNGHLDITAVDTNGSSRVPPSAPPVRSPGTTGCALTTAARVPPTTTRFRLQRNGGAGPGTAQRWRTLQSPVR